ncbi:Cardiolipin synthase A [compost metagenome]
MIEVGACFSPYDSESFGNHFNESYEAEAYRLYADPISENSSSNAFQCYLKEHFPTGIILKPAQHHELLLQAVQLATKSIQILSPWMLYTVVDKTFRQSLQESLNRGVDIWIGFGYKPSKFTLEEIDKIVQLDNFGSNLENTREAIEGLFGMLKDQLAYVPPIHSKILLVDDQFLFIGSHNWLSNKGKRNRDEISCLLTKRESVEYVRKQYLELVFRKNSRE